MPNPLVEDPATKDALSVRLSTIVAELNGVPSRQDARNKALNELADQSKILNRGLDEIATEEGRLVRAGMEIAEMLGLKLHKTLKRGGWRLEAKRPDGSYGPQ